jgi:Alginate export
MAPRMHPLVQAVSVLAIAMGVVAAPAAQQAPAADQESAPATVWTAPRYEMVAALQYVQFAGLPSAAVGPGPLGLGAVYYAHAGRSDSRQVYLRYLNVQLKNVLPGTNVRLGRMPYASGAEGNSGDPKIEAVKRQRVDARLAGEFDWSMYQRAFDGLRLDTTRPRWSATGVALRPTQGGFEDAAGLTMTDVELFGGNVTMKPGAPVPRTEWQLFAFRYIDDRQVSSRPDNSGLPAARVDVGVNTFGTTLIGSSSADEARQWDGLVWAAGQQGSWFGQAHRAFSVAIEAGYQWTGVAGRPWLRAGYGHASGDANPSDRIHGTFFQMLPTGRRFAQTVGYSQMNNTDLFAQLLLRPSASLGVRGDVHRVGLASTRDLWYFGSGATQSRGTTFGFSTRPSHGATGLGTTFEASADFAFSRHWSLNGFVGVMRAGPVARQTFRGRTMTLGYVENVLQF